MSAVLEPEISFEELRDKKAALLARAPITKDNEQLLYSSYISPTELNTLVLKDPEVARLAVQKYGQEWLDRRLPFVDQIIEKRVKPYRRAPIEYNMEERQPAYMEAKRNFEQRGQFRDYPGNVAPAPPSEPFGLEIQKEVAGLGWDPQIQFSTGDFSKDAKLRTFASFAPRNLTQRDLKHILKQFEIEGDIRFVNPRKPELGLLIKPEGAEDYQIFDLPYVTPSDTYEFIVQEFPAIAADIGLTVYGSKKFEPFLTGIKGTGAAKRGLYEIPAMSGLAATGAAGGDFLRLLVGKQMGAHDRDFGDMLKESGMIGAMAFGGTLVIGAVAKALPALYRKIMGEDVPQGFFNEIDELMKKAQASERGEGIFPSVTYGDEIAILDIRDSIQELARLTGKEFSEYNPTVASRSGLPLAEDFEAAFLKNATNPKLATLYRQIKDGNERVINEFLDALNKEIGEDFGAGVASVTGATTAEGVRGLIQKDIAQLEQNAVDGINNLRNNLLKSEDLATGGQQLLKEVPNEKISTPLFQRTRTRLSEIKEEYVKPFNEAWESALNNPRYLDAPPTGAGFTRGPATKWNTVSQRQTNQLFRSAEASEARGLFNELLGTEGGTVLKRLQGRNLKGRMESPEFTLQELNDARVVLNDFASNADNQVAAKAARDLERGIEQQMYRYLEGGAAKESGYKIGSKDLEQYMEDTGYGLDIAHAWSAQSKALKLSNAEAIQSIMQREPETVVDYILSTSTPGSKYNGKMDDFMEVLSKNGEDEIFEIRKAISQHVRTNILDNPDKSAVQIARDYQKFLKEHDGTLKTIFEGDFKYYGTPSAFKKNVLEPLQKAQDDIDGLQARFGSVANPEPTAGNIVEDLLSAGKTSRESGQVLADQEYLLSIINRNPTLKKQIGQVTKRWINQQILEPTAFGFRVSEDKLNRLIYDGFGPEDISGTVLSFENFIAPLLGKQSKQYVKNLKIFNSLVQRERGNMITDPYIQRMLKQSATPQTEYLRRFIIPPLTQTGRRATAAERLSGQKSSDFIGEMLLDDQLFRSTMDAYAGQITMDGFIRFLTSYSIIEAVDLGNELKYYDTVKKKQGKGSLSNTIKDTVTSTINTVGGGNN